MSARDTKEVWERRLTIQTLSAMASMGARFYDAFGLNFGMTDSLTLAAHVADWNPKIRAAVVATYKEACEVSAFAIERDDMRRGHYRLIRLGAGESKTGHLYHGETFTSAADMWNAMRTIEDLSEHPACKVTQGPKSIGVIGRLWFDRKNGNTYHTSEIIVDGKVLHKSERTYGYGNAYLDNTAADWLESQGIVKRERYGNGGKQPFWQACKAQGIALTSTTVDVATKKAL